MNTTVGSRFTDKLIRSLAKPVHRSRITYDDAIKGFGICIAKAGTTSFILNYSINGRERRIVIGLYPVWSISKAREQANKLRLMIDNGVDPLEDREANRAAWTVSDLAEEYKKIHVPNLSPASQKHAALTLKKMRDGIAPYRFL